MSNLEQYRQMHAAGFFPGNSTLKNSDAIKALIDQYKAVSLLDFGAGKGKQYDELKLHEAWGVAKPTLYDPAVPGIDTMPSAFRPFDGVICCDVLEHLESQELRQAIFDATIRARRFAFFSISTRAAKKLLPDGRNAHLTIQPRPWWEATVAAYRCPSECYVALVFDSD